MPNLRLLFPAALALCALLGAGQVRAQTTLDYFNFNNTSDYLARSGGVSSHNATSTSLTTSFQQTSATTDGYSFDANGGTSTNLNGDPTGAGGDLLLSTGSKGANNGYFLTLKTSTSGYQNLTLSFATRGSGSGFGAYSPDVLQYSLDNSNYQIIGSYYPRTSGSAYNTQTFNLSGTGGLGLTALNNASTVYLRIVFNGASPNSASSDYNKIDNLYLTGTAAPEPSGVVSMGIGLGMAGLGAGIRRRRQGRQKPLAGTSPE